jgi:alkylation response protein AidB-like acyl-CoA dehydrogenase
MAKKVKGGAFLLEESVPSDVYTPEDFTEEHKMIGKMTEDFIKGQVWPLLPQIEKHEFDHTISLLKEAGELGLLGADIPEQYGGLGLDKASSSLITEKIALGRSFALSHGAHVGIGTLPIVFFGNEEQKHKYLPDLASGEKLAAYALTEPAAGSDAMGAKTTAKLSDCGKYYILNGEKQWITNAGFADVFIVYAKVDGDKFTAFIVERDFPGVSVGPEEKKMGIKGSSTCTLILEDAQVPVENVLGEIGKGHKIAFGILNMGRYKLAVGTVGSAKRAIELSAQYANQRKQFNIPIAKFGLIREKIANMAIKTYASESLAYRIAGLIDTGLEGINYEEGESVSKAIGEYAMECSIAKVFGSEVLDYVVDEGVQIHGGYGYMSEYEIENLYRDSRINRIFEGTNEINRLLIPVTLMRKAMKGELPFFQAAQTLQDEIISYMPYLADESDPVLEAEKNYVENAKKIFLMISGLATMKYGEAIRREQEIVRDLCDLVIECFAMESALLRTLKAIDRNGEEKEQMKIDLCRCFVAESMQRVDQIARRALAAMEEGDMLRTQLSMLRKFTRMEPVNEVALKRAIAKRILAAEKYVV